MGHFKKAGITTKETLGRVQGFEQELNLGDTVTVDMFEGTVSYVDVIGTSKGKGFQGVVKRHGFGGVGQTTHGQHNRARARFYRCMFLSSKCFKGSVWAAKWVTACNCTKLASVKSNSGTQSFAY